MTAPAPRPTVYRVAIVPADRISISDVAPQIDCGRWPAKACVGDRVEVAATIVRDGHEVLRAVVRSRRGRSRWREDPLDPLGGDRFDGSFEVDAVGRWRFEVEAWVDRHAGWLDEYERKLAAGQADLAGELAEGEVLFGVGTVDEWRERADELAAADRHGSSRSGTLEVDVERRQARAGAWWRFRRRHHGVARTVQDLCSTPPRQNSSRSASTLIFSASPVRLHRGDFRLAAAEEDGDAGEPLAPDESDLHAAPVGKVCEQGDD